MGFTALASGPFLQPQSLNLERLKSVAIAKEPLPVGPVWGNNQQKHCLGRCLPNVSRNSMSRLIQYLKELFQLGQNHDVEIELLGYCCRNAEVTKTSSFLLVMIGVCCADLQLREGWTMCLKPEDASWVPEETSRIAMAIYPQGNRVMLLRELLGGVYQDDAFADCYPKRGQPAEAPWRLALVTVLQFLENLSDREAVEAIRSRIDWKYALGLGTD